MSLSSFRWGAYPGLFGWVFKCNHNCPYKREAEKYLTTDRENNVKMQQEQT